MLGPLPKLYRVIVSLSALLLFVGAGAWGAFMLPYPILVSVGASVGLAIGVVCAYLLLHQSHSEAQPHRVRRQHLN